MVAIARLTPLVRPPVHGLLVVATVFLAYACASRPSVCTAAPQLKSIFPTGVQVGGSVEVEASGKFEKWPVQVWVDRPGLELLPAKEKAKFTAKAAAEAEPGVYWIRLFDEQGTTPPFPVVVGSLPEIAEREPNDRPGQANEVALPSAILNGKLARRGDVDTFSVQLAKGQTLVAEVDANRTLESPVDCLLEIATTSGFVQARNEDHQGLDPRLTFVAPQDGRYLVRVFGFPATPDSTIGLAGGENYHYRLLLTVEGFVDSTWPLAISTVGEQVEVNGWNLPNGVKTLTPVATTNAGTTAVVAPGIANRFLVPVARHASIPALPGSSPQQPQTITLPATVTGRIAAVRESHSFNFNAAAGTTVVFRIESRELGFPLDPILELFDAAGKSLVRIDDLANGRDAELVFAIPAAGDYRLTVSDLHRQGGPRFLYRLRGTLALPDYALSLAADAFSVAAGEQLEIPVKVDRLNGFNQPVVVRVDGLPPTLQVEPVTSPADGDLSKEVKLILKAGDMPFAGPIQVTGSVAGAENFGRQAVATITGRMAKTSQPWLTITPPAKQ